MTAIWVLLLAGLSLSAWAAFWPAYETFDDITERATLILAGGALSAVMGFVLLVGAL